MAIMFQDNCSVSSTNFVLCCPRFVMPRLWCGKVNDGVILVTLLAFSAINKQLLLLRVAYLYFPRRLQVLAEFAAFPALQAGKVQGLFYPGAELL